MISDVIVGGPGLVAVGFDGCHGCDGLYDEGDYDEAVFGDDGQLTVTSVTARGPGIVAVGTGGVIVAERVGDDAELTVDD
jgi:hypothetical protein